MIQLCYANKKDVVMNFRLEPELEQKLGFFAEKLHTTKTDLIKPHVMRLIEDLEDYYHAQVALKEDGSISLSDLEKEFANVAN